MALNAALFQRLADKIVALAGDIRKAITYYQPAPGDYDPAAGATVDGPLVQKDFLVFATKTLDETEMAWFPAPEKVTKLLIPHGTWVAAGIVAKRNDYLVMDGVRWEIKRLIVSAADAYTKLYVESP